MRKHRESQAFGVVFLLLLLLVCYFAYEPGISSGFLFDDFPNLSPLGEFGGVRDWQTFQIFVSGGFSGPTGRPISLASFLLDDNTWPSDASYFKQTNLYIHLLCGLFLAWATLLLMRLWGVSERQCAWIALINMGVWLLHPMMVSTTLYVVQRMAQLAALFMFAGMAGYLHGRLLLSRHPVKAYLWMSLSILLPTFLATMSKENGALLPLLILVIEFCLPVTTVGQRPDWRWRLLFLWIPTLVVLGYLTKRINFSADLWPARNFNQPERLMSEARILWSYLYQLWIPRIEGYGLFQDGFQVSRSWLSPISTVYAVLGLFVLTLVAMIQRHRWPAFSLATLFFLASHLIESSVIGLELYFEHRNYAATAFMFLPLAMFAFWLRKYVRTYVAVIICACMLILLSGLTWQRSSLWGDTERLQNYWAVSSPESPRAQNWLATQLFEKGHTAEGLEFLSHTKERLSGSSLITMQWLLQRMNYGLINKADFKEATQLLAGQRFDAQTLAGMKALTSNLIQLGAKSEDRQAMIELIQSLDKDPSFRKNSVYHRFSPYFKGLIFVSEGNIEKAMPELTLAMDRHTDPSIGFSIIAHLGRNGYPLEGLELLSKMKAKYDDKIGIKLQAGLNEIEMNHLEQALIEDVAKQVNQ